MASSTIRGLDYFRIPLEEIVNATNNFADENVIGKGGLGNVYKGQALRFGKLENVIARRFDQGGQQEFLTEVSMLSRIQYRHINIITMIGFCEEKGEKIIVYSHQSNRGSLMMHLSDPDSFTWLQRIRLSVEVAKAIGFLHSGTTKLTKDDDPCYLIIHRNINSSTILLNEYMHPKLSGFEYSIQQSSSDQYLYEAIGVRGYMDPAILKHGGGVMMSHKSDVYSFGVVLFEILCGRKAYQDNTLLAPLARFHYEHGTLLDIILPGLWKQMHPKSLKYFSEAAYSCLEPEWTLRPNIHQVFDKLEKALAYHYIEREESSKVKDVHSALPNYEKHYKDKFKMSFEDIKLATQNFSLCNVIGKGGFGRVYRGELEDRTIVAKKLNKSRHGQGNKEFYKELQILCNYKHKNIIGLVGYSDETDEKIIVYEHASLGSLDKHLDNVSLTWESRLKICIDIASGLNFLHKKRPSVIHRDIKSSNILLFDSWKAKVSDFGLSIVSATNSYTIDNVCGTLSFVDPLYLKSGLLTKESDIYSFGVALIEILCGKTIYEIRCDASLSLLRFFEHNFVEEKYDELVFKAIYEEIVPNSLVKFLDIVYRCLHDDRTRRPSSSKVLECLKNALYIQVHGGRFTLSDIKFATRNFSFANEINRGNFRIIYKGEFVNEDDKPIIAKKFDTSIAQGNKQYYNEFQFVNRYKHKTIVSLVGYINETDEKILVYEHASMGSLDKYLNDASLTWTNRLKICIDFAIGLNILHKGVHGKEVVIHRNIKSSSILLFDDWKVKVGGFGVSTKLSKNAKCRINLDNGASGYVDPLYFTSGMLTIESDIYSFGVVLFEILCGEVVSEIHKHENESLLSFIKKNFEKETKQNDVMFNGIKGEIAPKSLDRYLNILYRCLDDDPKKRPSLEEVLQQLRWAFQFQEDYNLGCCLNLVKWLMNCEI